MAKLSKLVPAVPTDVASTRAIRKSYISLQAKVWKESSNVFKTAKWHSILDFAAIKIRRKGVENSAALKPGLTRCISGVGEEFENTQQPSCSGILLDEKCWR